MSVVPGIYGCFFAEHEYEDLPEEKGGRVEYADGSIITTSLCRICHDKLHLRVKSPTRRLVEACFALFLPEDEDLKSVEVPLGVVLNPYPEAYLVGKGPRKMIMVRTNVWVPIGMLHAEELKIKSLEFSIEKVLVSENSGQSLVYIVQ